MDSSNTCTANERNKGKRRTVRLNRWYFQLDTLHWGSGQEEKVHWRHINVNVTWQCQREWHTQKLSQSSVPRRNLGSVLTATRIAHFVDQCHLFRATERAALFKLKRLHSPKRCATVSPHPQSSRKGPIPMLGEGCSSRVRRTTGIPSCSLDSNARNLPLEDAQVSCVSRRAGRQSSLAASDLKSGMAIQMAPSWADRTSASGLPFPRMPHWLGSHCNISVGSFSAAWLCSCQISATSCSCEPWCRVDSKHCRPPKLAHSTDHGLGDSCIMKWRAARTLAQLLY